MTEMEKLAHALKAVDWNENVKTFLSDATSVKTIAAGNLRLAVWSVQFENVDKGNPALCFIREMQTAGHHAAALAALSLYKPAAASIRAMFEAALYYSYFRTHPAELATLARGANFFVDKKLLVDFHKQHTPNFVAFEQKLGLLTRLEKWYSFVSSIIHGKTPGTWVEHKSLSEIKYVKRTLDVLAQTFSEGEDLIH